jgi:nuclear GTP-binding protein
MIEKKVKAHKQKMKKFSKTNKQLNKNHKKSSKDPGIPNLFPYKAELMQKIMKDKEVAKQKGMQVNQLLHEPAQENMDYSSDEYEGYEQDFQHQDLLSNKHSTAGSYFKELNKVLNECDVVLEVLDARDPLGCRCRQIERRIVEESGKKLVLVLNKIDMVPNEVAESWIAYLKREFPTIAFKASTQTQKSKTAVFGGRLNVAGVKKELANTSQCLGGNELIQLLKNYCRSKDIKTSITVGVIGYPNVGKSSIINSLKRSRAVAVGSTPGLTKDVQEVHLDKNIKLLDSPGVIFFDDPNSTESSLALRNSLKLERLEDPVGVVHEMIKKVPKAQLLSVFQLDSFNSADEFVLKIAAQKGKLKKGGIPDIYAASISILRDWNEGKIPFYTIPPAIPESEHASQARVVSDYAAEFDIAALESGNSMVTTLSSSSASAPVEPRIRDQTYQLAVDVEMH